MVLLEICSATALDAACALKGGAHRIELCSALEVGGLTPSYGQIAASCTLATQGVVPGRDRMRIHVLIRPRSGDFCYQPEELDIMCHDIIQARTMGADGVVVGALTPDGLLDVPAMQRLVQAAKGSAIPAAPVHVVFHRAMDCCRNPLDVLEQLIALKVDTVLTSGQAEKAVQGVALIREMVQRASGRIAIMAGSGVNSQNCAALVAQTGVQAVHLSGRSRLASPVTFYPQGESLPSFGGQVDIPNMDYFRTSVGEVAACLGQLPA